MGERGPDELLLPGRGAGGPAGVRPGGAQGPAAAAAALARRAGRNAHSRGDLPDFQRRPTIGPRVGDGHVHRYRVRTGDACPGGAPFPGWPAHLHPHRRCGGRPGGLPGHRHGVQRLDPRGGAGGRTGDARPRAGRPAAPGAQWRGVPGARPGGLGGPPEVRCRPGDRGGRHRPAGHRLSSQPGRPGEGYRPVSAVPGTADLRAGPVGPAGSQDGPVPERTASVPLPPGLQLRDRAPVCPGQCRHPDQRQLPGARLRFGRSLWAFCSAT